MQVVYEGVDAAGADSPEVVEFYDKEWTLRGAKASLSKALEAVTGIDGQVLRDSTILADVPVARRMSWAANRRTTRVEDIAYCLLGIFDVSMPMLYGEGEKAFARLQEEIAKETNDLTLFAWQARALESSNSGDAGVQKYRGILATSPAEFLNAGAIVAGDDVRFNEEFLMTNKGMRLNSGLDSGPGGSYVLNLNCCLRGDPTQQIDIYLKLHGASLYAREQPDRFALQSQWQLGKANTIYISKRLTRSQSASLDKEHRRAFFFRSGLTNPLFSVQVVRPMNLWDSQRRLFLTHGMASFTGYIRFSPGKVLRDRQIIGSGFLLVCGITAGEGQEEPRSWVAIGNTLGQPELYRTLGDLKKLGEVGSRYESKSTLMKDMYQREHIAISVEMEEALVDGELMYCVDLKYKDLTGAGEQA